MITAVVPNCESEGSTESNLGDNPLERTSKAPYLQHDLATNRFVSGRLQARGSLTEFRCRSNGAADITREAPFTENVPEPVRRRTTVASRDDALRPRRVRVARTLDIEIICLLTTDSSE